VCVYTKKLIRTRFARKFCSCFVLKWLHGSISRDGHFAIPQFDFYFKVVLPKANKERLIMERDYLGRIVSSKVPESPITYA
jgi:hypothetical protein